MKKLKILILPGLLALTLAIAGCGDKAAVKTVAGPSSKAVSAPAASSAASGIMSAVSTETYTNAAYHLTLDYPSGWQLTEGAQGAICTVSASGTSTGATLTAQSVSSGTTLYSFNQTTVAHLQSTTAQYTQLANDELRFAGGYGYKVDYTTVQSGVTVRYVKYYCVVGSRAFTLTCTAPAGDYDTYAKQFSDMLKSLTIKP